MKLFVRISCDIKRGSREGYLSTYALSSNYINICMACVFSATWNLYRLVWQWETSDVKQPTKDT